MQHPIILGVATTVSVSSGNQSRPRHSAAQIAEFFEVFDRVDGDVSAAARELGLNRVTCAGWVRKAGLRGQGRPGWKPHPRQREFFTLLKEGMPLGVLRHHVSYT
ncbi:hypothetical protein GCM10009636_21300 [Arthrobacter koreensis]